MHSQTSRPYASCARQLRALQTTSMILTTPTPTTITDRVHFRQCRRRFCMITNDNNNDNSIVIKFQRKMVCIHHSNTSRTDFKENESKHFSLSKFVAMRECRSPTVTQQGQRRTMASQRTQYDVQAQCGASAGDDAGPGVALRLKPKRSRDHDDA